MDKGKSFVIIGAGNLAKSLCANLHKKGYRLLMVISTSESSRVLAKQYHSASSTSIEDIPPHADFILISVKDDALLQVVDQIRLTEIPVFHTNGSISISLFENRFKHYGVFYPLQTFSEEPISLQKIPLLIESNDELSVNMLSNIAQDLSDMVYSVNSEKRQWIHLAAVFACNFANHMQTIAGDILEANHISPEIIKPLIEETCRKMIKGNPRLNQTGPARRGDSKILASHSLLLEQYMDYKGIYELISNHILKTYITNNK